MENEKRPPRFTINIESPLTSGERKVGFVGMGLVFLALAPTMVLANHLDDQTVMLGALAFVFALATIGAYFTGHTIGVEWERKRHQVPENGDEHVNPMPVSPVTESIK